MFHFSPRGGMARRVALATALVAVPACLSASPALAVPVSLKVNYTCNFPLMDPQPLALDIRADVPARLPVSEPSGNIPLDATATVSSLARKGLYALEAATLQGTARASGQLVTPDGTPPLDVAVNTTITKTDIPASGQLVTTAKGSIPSLYSDVPGPIVFKVRDQLLLKLDPRLADGGLTGLDRFETECTLVPGQQTTLATVQVGDVDAPPTAPTNLTATPSENAVALSWSPSTDDIGVAGYDVYQGSQKVASVTSASAVISGLEPNRDYTFKVQARDSAGQLSPLSSEIATRTTGGGTVGYAYTLAGSAQLKTLTTGSIPLSGTYAMALDRTAGTFSAELALNQATARLTAIGFLPVTAKLAFVTSGPTTGTLAGGVLTSTTKLRVKVPEVKLFGAIPLAGGNNCQAKQLSTVTVKSSGAAFNPAVGGTLAGSFALSDLNGCGLLNGLVSPLTAGANNPISFKLTPKPIA